MNVIIYTIAPTAKGGGGRRVFSGILNGLLSLRHSVVVVSERKYPDSLKSDQDSGCHYLSLNEMGSSGAWEREFRNYAKKIDAHVLLCDTEYALSNLVTSLPKFCNESSIPIYSFFHDQIWRDHMSLLSVAHKERCLHPYYRYSEYLKSRIFVKRSAWQEKTLYQSDVGRIKGVTSFKGYVRRKLPKLVNAVEVVKAYLRLRNARKNVAVTSGIISLTKRSAEESSLVYRVNQADSFACYGYIDEALRGFARQCAPLREEAERVIAFCRLSPEKNLDLVILSFLEALRVNGNLKLTIIGRNDSAATSECVAYLRSLIEEYKCGNSISLIENPSDEILVKELGLSNVMICAQNCDFNLTIYEGMYLGKQVIVPASYSLPKELAESKNIYSDNIEIDDFASSILIATSKKYHIDSSEREFLQSCTYDRYAELIADFLNKSQVAAGI
jgi:glycosyltransferase involved in cell wall biosynthesis